MDGDGDLDLALAVGNAPNRIFENLGGTLSAQPVWESVENDNSQHVAWADWDGDGDLDLAVVNRNADEGGRENRVYENRDGILSTTATWSSAETDKTRGLSWGDWDGDGDLDMAVGGDYPGGQVNRVYVNGLISLPTLPNNPAYADLDAPIPTGESGYQYSPVILTGPHVTLSYRLFDAEGDTVQRVYVQYSPVGGGYWIEPTLVGGDGLTDLAASPEGTLHSLVWDVSADNIQSDHVVVRLVVVQSNPSRAGLIRYPRLATISAPFRVHAGP
jgi:hypothetical protein